MLDRTEQSNELFRFSTKEEQWKKLNATSPSGRAYFGMVAVGNDFYVFGGRGEEGLCHAGQSLGAYQT
jgi:N-acetylneuraminic acid mutarotase